MNRNIKLLIGAGIGVAVLGAALAVVLTLPSDQVQVRTDDTNAIILVDKEDLLANEITVENSGGSYQLFGYEYEPYRPAASSSPASAASPGTGSAVSVMDAIEIDEEEISILYTMQEYEDEILYKPFTDELCRECCSLTAKQLIDKSGTRYEEYGLDKPAASVSVVFSDNSQAAFFIGKDAPENKGVYLRMQGDNSVYLVDYQSVEMFLKERLQMFDHTVTGSIGKDVLVDALSIEGTAYPETLRYIRNNNVINKGQYIQSEPYRCSVNENNLDSAAKGMFGIIGTEVAAVAVGEDQLKDYGLDKPYERITVTTTDTNSVTVCASAPDEEGKYYLKNEKGTTVFRMDKDDLFWYDIKVHDLLADPVIYDELAKIAEMDLTVSGTTDHYVFHTTQSTTDNYTEGSNTKIYKDDSQISYDHFYHLYSNLESILCTENVPESLEGMEEIFKITMTFTTENKDNQDTLSFYQAKDKTITAVLNGHIRSEIDSEKALQIVGQSQSLAKNEAVPLFTDSSDSAG